MRVFFTAATGSVQMSESVYRQRDPQNTTFYTCVEDHFEAFEQVYDERFERQYGYSRPYVQQLIYRYLECGVLGTVSPGSAAMNAATRTCWAFPVKDAMFAHRATRSAWWNSVSGSAETSSRPCRTGTWC